MPISLEEIYEHRNKLKKELKKVDALIEEITHNDRVKEYETLLHRTFKDNSPHYNQYTYIERITKDGQLIGTRTVYYGDENDDASSMGEIRTNEHVTINTIEEYLNEHTEVPFEEYQSTIFKVLKHLKIKI